MTKELFREDSYIKSCTTIVQSIDDRGVQFEQSIFYPLGGGQPGDTGSLITADGVTLGITDTTRDRATGEQFHAVNELDSLQVGDNVELVLDWQRRHRIMRFHSCLHMLCACIEAPVTSGSIQVDRARLDFDLQEPIDKDPITEKLNALILRNAPMSTSWISNAELAAQPEMVRTLSVQPPRNAEGTIRLVEFKGIDLQPCGGTHVASTGEIGPVRVKKIEKKGKRNRRIIVVFDECE